MASRLTAEQTQFFNDNGYLLFHQPVFSTGKFAALKAHFDHKVADFEQRTGKSPEHMDVPHFTDPKLFDWLLDDAVLDIVASLVGPDIQLFSSHFICKPPGRGKRVPWHEDSAYWKGRLDPMEVITIWLAIDPADEANGCMKVIPGTHDHGFHEYHTVDNPGEQVFDGEINPSAFNEADAVPCILDANECSIHHGKMIHGSDANTSNRRRCGYTMRYMPASVKHGADKPYSKGFQIYQARGRNLAGNAVGTPGQINEAWLATRPEQRALVTAS